MIVYISKHLNWIESGVAEWEAINYCHYWMHCHWAIGARKEQIVRTWWALQSFAGRSFSIEQGDLVGCVETIKQEKLM